MQSKLNLNHFTRTLIGLVLIFAISVMTFNFYNQILYFNLLFEHDLTFNLAVKLVYHSKAFIMPVIIGLSIIGLLVKNPIGWILSNTFFSSIVAIWIFIKFPTADFIGYYYLLTLIPAGLILLMNNKKTTDYYNIKRTDLLTYNLIVIILGLSFAFIWGYFMVHPGKHYIDVI